MIIWFLGNGDVVYADSTGAHDLTVMHKDGHCSTLSTYMTAQEWVDGLTVLGIQVDYHREVKMPDQPEPLTDDELHTLEKYITLSTVAPWGEVDNFTKRAIAMVHLCEKGLMIVQGDKLVATKQGFEAWSAHFPDSGQTPK